MSTPQPLGSGRVIARFWGGPWDGEEGEYDELPPKFWCIEDGSDYVPFKSIPNGMVYRWTPPTE